MTVSADSKRRFPPGQRFWVVHLWLPLLVFAVLAVMFETLPLDLWFADALYALEGGHWALRSHWFTYDVMHHYGKLAVISFGLGVLTLALLGCCIERLKPWRRPLGYLVTGLVLIPVAISYIKHFNDVPCPWDLARYGGDLPYRHSFQHAFGVYGGATRSCFPAGHAAGGYALLVIYFTTWPYARRPALFLLPGLVVGIAFGLAQQLRGGHFLSHDLWTAALTWFAALALFVLFRPSRWGRPG